MEILYTQSNYEVIPVSEATKVRFYTSIDPGSYVPPHWHDALEIVYLQTGELTFSIENRTRILKPGQCILVSPNIIHSTKCTMPNTAIVFQIPIKFLETLIPDVHQMLFVLDDQNDVSAEYSKKTDALKNTLHHMQVLNDERPNGYLLLFNSLLYDLIYRLYKEFSIPLIHMEYEHKSHILTRLTPILNYTAQHYKESISIQQISDIAALQPTYFCRFFKKNMGITYLEYQNELRLSYILRDLISTNNSISFIMGQHGFTNYKLLCRLFRQHFDATPSQIRKNLKKSALIMPGKKGD